MIVTLLLAAAAVAEPRPRARDLGVPFAGHPGPLNAITDVTGVTVGHATLVRGEGKLTIGQGPVRTGVTAILPRGKTATGGVFAGSFVVNGNGELTGLDWVRDSGFLEGPVMMTNTHAIGAVHEGVIAWRLAHGGPDVDGYAWSTPVVGETWDGFLNDVNGFHVRARHVAEAIDGSRSGPVVEGSVGGGTGMTCFEFKGGIGTSSRKLDAGQGGYTVGVLVQCNCGRRAQLTIGGVPVGLLIPERTIYAVEQGSILITVATDAPLLPHTLDRLAKRATMGLARVGSVSGNGSGDFVFAFSTANANAATGGPTVRSASFLGNDALDPLFEATVQATEEAIVNAMVAADTMVGVDGHTAMGLPHDRLKSALAKYGKLAVAP
jgi:L-aminopeptidase/D-esterase-like protein